MVELKINLHGRIRAGKFLSHLLPVVNVSCVRVIWPTSRTYLQGRMVAGRHPGVSTHPKASLSLAKEPGFAV